jgi:hypothetical protein
MAVHLTTMHARRPTSQAGQDSPAARAWEDVAFAEFVGDGMGGPPQAYTQRMIRCADWKLSYYHGYPQPLQLFNLMEVGVPPSWQSTAFRMYVDASYWVCVVPC